MRAAALLARTEERWSEAEALAVSCLESRPADSEMMLVLGEALEHLGSPADALDTYRRISAGSHSQNAATLAIASLFMRQGRLSDAETELQSLRAPTSQSPEVQGLWGTLLSLSGRQWEANLPLHRSLKGSGNHLAALISLADPAEMPAPPQAVFAQMLRVRDPLGLLGCAKIASSVGRKDQAISLLREALSRSPELLEAQLLLATLLVEAGDEASFFQCFKQLPDSAWQHPAYWLLLATRAESATDSGAAIRCYWETLRRIPDYDRATYQLGQLLAAEQRGDEAQQFSDRARKLSELTEHSAKLYDRKGSATEIALCARLTLELGRLPECRAWCELLPDAARPTFVREIYPQVRKLQRGDTPALLPEADLAKRFDLSSYPLPDLTSQRIDPSHTRSGHPASSSDILFLDEAAALGLQFTYFNGEISASPGRRMFEYTGGGVAAFDYDLDGWCDLYFTQGTTWPPDTADSQFLDALFRNVAGIRMCEVSHLAGIHDAGFGQGVAAGDFDNDGFPDLYVANIDGNRLYKNQGDGTFLDMTSRSGLARYSHWTTSCLLADLDGDSLPDVYDVTYLTGDEIYTRVCQGDDTILASCPPSLFPAAVDHVYQNQGDGTFIEMTREWGFDAPNGDGLGIVAADFDESQTISLFVANDGRPNFFFAPQRRPDGKLVWQELGLVSGLAYDEAGAALACMGVAAGDPNNDGRVDLFVTNFYNESNSLYINLGARTFSDRARTMRLRDPSWSLLGFGTQFIDADHDGLEDLILVNGHVDDFSYKQIPYKMRPQFFQNTTNSFQERFADEIGDFFTLPRLGRGVARIDWNRDGLDDLAISHIGDPAALLTNKSPQPGRGLRIQLVATNSSRDAIGTRVTVQAGQKHLTRQLTAGDGYQASNQRLLDFGLGNDSPELTVDIHWISGSKQSFTITNPTQHLIAVEGNQQLLPITVESH
ncbi:FG-GAP-like repeat-containing protein [Schlesneria sp.]|uniref:FG-GAP-like repeat-containing protein n=1 Tax=Schlesneria sp. TaxID=2762018 RepID=UPI002EF62297